jgi:hypothetical protein
VRDIPIFGDKASVPSHIGGLRLEGIETYSDARLGTAFQFSGENVEATTYLYNLGLTNIPSDLRSGEVVGFLEQAYLDVLRTAASGLYLDLELSEPQFLYLPDDDRPFCLGAEFAFRHSPESGVGFTGRCASHLALRTDGRFINKVRYTYPESEAGEADCSARLLAFMVEWTVFVQASASTEETKSTLVASQPGQQLPS